MNIKLIKENLTKQKGELLYFKYNGMRNQTEEFNGKIIGIYSSIFTIQIDNVNNLIKSFTYSDVLTEQLEIKEIK